MNPTHTLSKKIDRGKLTHDRNEYDGRQDVSTDNFFVTPIIHGKLTEDTARVFVYADYYSRFTNLHNAVRPFFSWEGLISSGNLNFNYEQYLHHNQESYFSLQKELSALGVYAHIDDMYSSSLHNLYHTDQVLTDSHRVGVRADIAYYDITSGTIVPEYHILKKKINKNIYTIRFFLNTTKDTVLSDIMEPYYLFGCVALLVHPNDKRYKKLRGRDIILPITNKQVPIIPYEGVSIDGHGTKLLVPAHNAKDFAIALELDLPTDVYAFDKYGNFSEHAKHFADKPLLQFSENVLKYIDDISNLESTRTIEYDEYTHKYSHVSLFPLLQKNMYMSVGHKDIEDDYFVKSHHSHGDTSDFTHDLAQEEYFCITNQDVNRPMVSNLGGIVSPLVELQIHTNLVQDILCDFFLFGILASPVRGDNIVDAFSLTYNDKYIWKMFYEYRIQHTDKKYENSEEILRVLENITSENISSEDIDIVLGYIDMDSYFMHTKNGYLIPSDTYTYHYDSEYIGLAHMLALLNSDAHLHFLYTAGEYKYIKYFLYMYSYIYNKAPEISYHALSTQADYNSSRTTIKSSLNPDTSRLYLLQSVKISDYDGAKELFTPEQIDRFLLKWWNLSRIIPVYAKSSLSELKEKIIKQKENLSDYDLYLLTKIHELYDEVVFLQGKDHIDAIISLTLSTLWYEISDLMLYILKKIPSPVSELTCAYVTLFAQHILYPLLPTTTLGIVQGLGYTIEKNFFQDNHTLFVEKHYKSNLMLHIISQWYKNISQNSHITGFILQANRDFLEYFKEHSNDFKDFVGEDLVIRFLDESDMRPVDVVNHKIFTMQRGIIEQTEVVAKDQPSPSLSILQGQLQYKQQLLQTMKNTIVRMRSTAAPEKITTFQSQIDTLLKEITDLEYQISKLKYF